MTAEEIGPWSRHSVLGFAAQLVTAGVSSEPEATAYAKRQFAHLLPDGPATPGNRIWTVRLDDGTSVGSLWLRLLPVSGRRQAFVVDVEVEPGLRGQGLGRATMCAAESAARDLGADVISLNVFGHNRPALGLYDALGYAVSTATLSARLGATPGPPAGRVSLRELGGQEYSAVRPSLDRAAGGGPDSLLPDGPATSGERLYAVLDGAAAVGTAWMSLQHRADGVHALVRHVEVRPELRRRGYGRSTVLALRKAAQELGVVTLTAESGDPVARAMFASSALDLTAQTMTKDL
jgi:GNAT superfamily N-acetyltransferase